MDNPGMFLGSPPQSEAVDALFAKALADDGYLANWLRLWAWRPDVFESYAASRGGLVAGSALTERDLAVLVTATASRARRFLLLARLGVTSRSTQ